MLPLKQGHTGLQTRPQRCTEACLQHVDATCDPALAEFHIQPPTDICKTPARTVRRASGIRPAPVTLLRLRFRVTRLVALASCRMEASVMRVFWPRDSVLRFFSPARADTPASVMAPLQISSASRQLSLLQAGRRRMEGH